MQIHTITQIFFKNKVETTTKPYVLRTNVNFKENNFADYRVADLYKARNWLTS